MNRKISFYKRFNQGYRAERGCYAPYMSCVCFKGGFADHYIYLDMLGKELKYPPFNYTSIEYYKAPIQTRIWRF